MKAFKRDSLRHSSNLGLEGIFIPVNMALGATQPLVPLLVLQLGGTIADVGLTVSVYSVSAIFSSKLWGAISDRSGKRKPFVILGFASTSIVLLLFSFARIVSQLILLNALMGFLTTAYVPSAAMLLIERYPKREWTSRLSTYNFFCGIGWVLGLAVGAVWLSFGSLKSLLLLLALSSIVGTALGTYFIKEPLITLERSAFASFGSRMLDWTRYIPTLVFGLPELLDSSKWRRLFRIVLPHFYLSAAVILTAASMFFTPLPTYFQSIQLSESMIYLLFIVHNLTATVTFIFDRMISSRANEQRLVYLALLVRFVAFFSFSIASIMGAFVGRGWIISMFLVFTGASWALFWAPLSSYLSKIADQHRLGEAQGALNASVAVGSILGSVTSGYLIAISSYQLNFLISSLVVLAGLFLFLRVKV